MKAGALIQQNMLPNLKKQTSYIKNVSKCLLLSFICMLQTCDICAIDGHIRPSLDHIDSRINALK